jgi:hypothetical protein
LIKFSFDAFNLTLHQDQKMAVKAQRYLEKILSSKEFSNAPKYQQLLQYLVSASLEGNTPKEVNIACDVFGADPKQDISNDPKVRVYVYNMRKKLDSYYVHEGKEDDLLLEIPKGGYEVLFVPKSQVKKIKSHNTLSLMLLATLLISILANVFFVFFDQRGKSDHAVIDANNPFWADYLGGKNPIMIVFGDYYLYRDRQLPDRIRFVRDFRINSKAELEQFLLDNKLEREKILETEHTFLGKGAPWCLYEFQSVLIPQASHLELQLASQLQWDDLSKYNILFVGSFKTMRILSEFVKNLHFTYKVDPNTLIYHPPDADTSFSYRSTSSTPDQPFETDYVIIAKIPSGNQNVITLFASTRDIGSVAAVDVMTQNKYLKPFISDYLKNNKYFEAIFRVEGYARNVVNIKLLHFNALKLP